MTRKTFERGVQVRPIRLTVIESDDTRNEFLIESDEDGLVLDIRRAEVARCEADRSCAIDIGNEHCPVCLEQPDQDCETVAQTLVLEVEFADA